MGVKVQFGYYPKELNFSVGAISISTLDDLEGKSKWLKESGLVEGDWVYAPPAEVRHLGSNADTVQKLPYSCRVFGLPKTHLLHHAGATGPEHIDFLIWAMSFVYGMRLSAAEAGLLDATPIEPGKLHDDMDWSPDGEQKALGL